VPAVEAVVFDVGETLVDETRYWREWADWLGVPQFTFFGVLGGVIARGEDHRRVFDLVAPGLDVADAIEQRRREGDLAGPESWFAETDLYPDAAPCLRELRARGFRVGLAANQPEGAVESLSRLGVDADFVGSSADWGVWKPSPLFFHHVADAARCPPGRIAYVGDRVDNDVVPSATAGMVAVFVRRGPWGYLQAERPEAAIARVRVDSLAELPDAFARV
jgi:HAD superfamily hydrolase (TIGR01549 family)